MKTIEELYKEINASEELRKVVSQIRDKDALADFLKKQGCEASVDEFEEFIESQREGEIGDDAATAVAGGLEGNGLIGEVTQNYYRKPLTLYVPSDK